MCWLHRMQLLAEFERRAVDDTGELERFSARLGSLRTQKEASKLSRSDTSLSFLQIYYTHATLFRQAPCGSSRILGSCAQRILKLLSDEIRAGLHRAYHGAVQPTMLATHLLQA